MAKAGIVQNITGNVVAKGIDGSVRTLFPGDEILLNEVIETSGGAKISILLNDGNTIVLGGNETMVFDESTAGLLDNQDAVVDDVAELQKALADGENIDDLQQETAAGFEESAFEYNEEYLSGDNSSGDVNSRQIDVEPESGDAEFDSSNENDDRSNLGIDTVEGIEDQVLVIDVSANDSLADGSVISAVTNGAHGSAVIVDGKIQYTPDKDFEGDDSFTYTVRDEDGSTSTTSVNVVINDEGNPTAVDDNAAMVEDQSILFDVTANDSMIDGAVLSGVTNGANGKAEIIDGKVKYTPDKDFEGEDSFTYTITDEDGIESTATVKVVVDDEGNPNAVGDEARVTEEQFVVIDVTANDSMVDGATLSGVTDGSHGKVEIIDGKAEYTPDKDFEGEDSFTYTITDEDGSKSTATVKVIVDDEGNPSAVGDEARVTEEQSVVIDVTANDSMVDGSALTNVTNGANGTVEIIDGKAKYTPNKDFEGEDEFTYTITDEDGSVSRNTVKVIVDDEGNPSAAGDEARVTEGQSVVIDVTANDSMVDGATLSGVTDGSHGKVEIIDGKVKYTPDKDFEGEDSFTYTITDEDGIESTATVKVVVDDEGNPNAVGDEARVTEEQFVVIDVTANDSMVDGATLSGVTDGSHGKVEIIEGKVKYTPDKDFEGEDSFTYTITDEDGIESTATVKVVVDDEGNPSAVGDEARATEEQSVVIDVTANDSMVDGATLSGVTDGSHGKVEIIDGKAEYTPNKDFEGEDSFTYTITDEDGIESTATVKVVVDDEGNPSALNDEINIKEDSSFTIDVTANDSMVDGSTLTDVTSGSHGKVEIIEGKVKYTPDKDFEGEDSFTYTITDEDGIESTATVKVIVDDEGNPSAVNDEISIREDTSVTINVTTNDSMVDGSELKEVTNGSHGKVEIVDGEVKYTPDENFSGQDSFTYTIADEDGVKSTATVKVIVDDEGNPNAVNDEISTKEDTSVTINVTTNDSMVDGATLSGVTDGSHGKVEIVDGEVKYTPDENFSGQDSFTYTIADEDGVKSTATVKVNVTGVADTPLISFDTGGDNVVESGLIGHWTFDEGSENKTFNQVGNNYGILKYGAQFDSTGHNGSSILLDKDHAFVDVKDGGFSNQLSKTATMSAWIKIPDNFRGSDTGWNSPSIAGSEQVGGVSDVQWGWLDGSGHMNINVGNAQGAQSSTAVNDGEWHHVVMSRDASTGETKIYIDGNLESTVTNDGLKGVKKSHIDGFGKTNANDGKETSAIDKFLKGELDDIRVYDRVLTDKEVRDINGHEANRLTIFEGDEGTKFSIDADFVDNDGSEKFDSIKLSGIPEGAVIEGIDENGNRSTVGSDGDVTGWDLDSFSIKFEDDSIDQDKEFTLTATATTSENGTTATSSADIDVKVINDTKPEAVADEATLVRNSDIFPEPIEGNILKNDKILGGIGTPSVDSAVLLTSVVYAGTSYAFGENDSITIDSGLGIITFSKDGSYNYREVLGDFGWEKQEFTYTIEDADGDKSSNVLTIYNSMADRDSDAADDSSRSFAQQNDSDAIDSSDDSSDLKDDNSFGTDNDDFIGAHEGSDEIHAGAGDDSIVFDSDDTIVDGGTGFDSLLINNSSLDFSNVKTDIQNIEKLDLNSNEKQVVKLTLNDVMDMTDSNNTLEIAGGAEDSVEIDTTGWENKGDGIFSNGTDTVHISFSDDDSDLVSFHSYTDDGTEISKN